MEGKHCPHGRQLGKMPGGGRWSVLGEEQPEGWGLWKPDDFLFGPGGNRETPELIEKPVRGLRECEGQEKGGNRVVRGRRG